MKKRSIIITLFIIFLVLAGLTYISMMHLRGMRDRQCQRFADDFVLAVTKNWDRHELVSRANIKYLETVSQQKLDELFASLKRLGNLKQYDGVVRAVDKNGRWQPSDIYTADAVFDAGPAAIEIELIPNGHKWQILKFNIESNALSK
jgi:hypothetical protein